MLRVGERRQKGLRASTAGTLLTMFDSTAVMALSIAVLSRGRRCTFAMTFGVLLDAIQQGIERDRTRRQENEAVAGLKERFESLTPREREVMALVIIGRLNKQIAGQLGVSEITVKVHRGQVMQGR